jgi:hypothetical protein
VNIEEEIRASRKKLQRFIDREFLIAQARVEGMGPKEYAAKLDANRPNPMEEVGRAYRQMYNSIMEAVYALARGWNSAGR